MVVTAGDATLVPMALVSGCGAGDGCDVAHAATAIVESKTVRALRRMRLVYIGCAVGAGWLASSSALPWPRESCGSNSINYRSPIAFELMFAAGAAAA